MPNKRIFNNAKICDHFAIIPTPQAPKNLNELEQKLYDLVVRRFLAVFFPAPNTWSPPASPASKASRSRPKARCWSIRAGWPCYGKEGQEGDEGNLVAVNAGEKVKTEDVTVKANETKPPPRYSEATLLSAMEGAGKLVDDEELRRPWPAAVSARRPPAPRSSRT